MSTLSHPPPSYQTGQPDLRASRDLLLPTNYWLGALFFLFLLPALSWKLLSLRRRTFVPMLRFDCNDGELRNPTLFLRKRLFSLRPRKDQSSRMTGYDAGYRNVLLFFLFQQPTVRLSPKSLVFRDATVYRSGAESFTPPPEHFYQSM